MFLQFQQQALIKTISYKKRDIIIILDIEGGDKIKFLWKHYYEKMKYVIFVIDILKKNRMEEYILHLTY